MKYQNIFGHFFAHFEEEKKGIENKAQHCKSTKYCEIIDEISEYFWTFFCSF